MPISPAEFEALARQGSTTRELVPLVWVIGLLVACASALALAHSPVWLYTSVVATAGVLVVLFCAAYFLVLIRQAQPKDKAQTKGATVTPIK